MTELLNIAGDFAVWDRMEDVILAQVLQPEQPARALRRTLTNRELLTSRGVYTNDDVAFIVPQTFLDEGFFPRPADTVTDGEGTVWTVLESSDLDLRSEWKLVCRNLVLAGGLYDTIDIQRASLVQTTPTIASCGVTKDSPIVTVASGTLHFVTGEPVTGTEIAGGIVSIDSDTQITLSAAATATNTAATLTFTPDVTSALVLSAGGGAKVKAWPPIGGYVLYDDLVCRVQPVTQEIVDERGMRATKTRYDVIVAKQLALTYEDRIAWGTKYLEIREYHAAERIDQFPVLTCELVP